MTEDLELVDGFFTFGQVVLGHSSSEVVEPEANGSVWNRRYPAIQSLSAIFIFM